MGSEFPGSHCRLCIPFDTFANFHRWIHMSNQGYRVSHPRGYLSLLAIHTRFFFFLFLLCDRETQFGLCPILSSPPLNTKHSVDLPCTHNIPLNTKHNVYLYHVLTPNLVPFINCGISNDHKTIHTSIFDKSRKMPKNVSIKCHSLAYG